MTVQRRTEDRVRSRGFIRLLTADGRSISATLHDVSHSGLSVDAKVALVPEQYVDIEGGGLSASATVKHCLPNSAGFRIGLALLPTL